jgi:AraC family transcriptional regulator
MNIELRELPPVTVACLRYTGPYGPGIEPFWRNTVYAWLREEGMLGRARYGVSLDNPGVTPPEQCRYDAGVEAPPGYVPTGDAHLTALPGGLYAVLPFSGPPAEIGAAWHALLEEWLPGSGYRHAGSPPYEYLPAEGAFNPATGELRGEIRVPVRR